MKKTYSKAAAGTFKLNKQEPIHRWYSYLEGYSSCLVEDLLRSIEGNEIKSVYDPFCGTGTTALVAAKYGIESYYSETNPFMRLVIEAKINCVKRMRESGIKTNGLKRLRESIEEYSIPIDTGEPTWDGFEKYFDPKVLRQILDMKDIIAHLEDKDTRKIAKVLLSAVIVRASKMTRQGDLRYAKAGEKSDQDFNVVSNFREKVIEAIEDIENESCPILAGTTCLADDARNIDAEGLIDCVITSPPYLNGTNYVRNTKLELKLCDFIKSEKDLPTLHSKGIIAGINSVSKRTSDFTTPECAVVYVEKLKPVAYDKRIPVMVAGYFNDMEKVIERLSVAMRDEAIFVMDIGDSQFAGVHIPTHEILSEICEKYGFVLCKQEILRERRSKNGMTLSQRLLKFKLHKYSTDREFATEAKKFMEEMPYRKQPYTGRNWGHPWHSLCSYHGKLKPAIAHFMISEFTSPGDVVLDPLCGVGTIPFEACLQGRYGIGNDLSEMAYVVTKAKLERPELAECENVLNQLQNYISENTHAPFVDEDIEKYRSFGFNGKIEDYFHPDTFREILCGRRFFAGRIADITAAEAMVYSCLLHVLHGNRPYALSRRSHPLTPYAPSGEFIYKNMVEHISAKLRLTYNKGDFDSFVQGYAVYGDYNFLRDHPNTVDAIICSPPFADSIRFYMQNWMRLWLCGWEEEDYKKAESLFLDQRQKKDFDVYLSFFEMCYTVLKPKGKVILHLGKTSKVDMAEELSKRSAQWFNEAYRADEDVQSLEKHGIKDKGGTIDHQFLFLEKK
jgi:tRNA G10  N-methylase Trm11